MSADHVPVQQTRSGGARRPVETDKRTDGRTPDSCIDTAPHTMPTVPVTCVPCSSNAKAAYETQNIHITKNGREVTQPFDTSNWQ